VAIPQGAKKIDPQKFPISMTFLRFSSQKEQNNDV